MIKTTLKILVVLIVLTIATAVVSNFVAIKFGVLFILLLSAIKFLLVTFQFMELKKAHSFWKIAILLFLIAFMVIITALV